ITDGQCLQAIKLVEESLREAVSNGENLEARTKMVEAEMLGGMAFNNADLGYVHAMAHQLGGQYDAPHGVCCAILLPIVERFNLVACPDRFTDLAVAMGENIDGLSIRAAADKAIDAMQQLNDDVGIP
ncbi:iron-containing alcohol dehydrogenase, partial [Enterococcus faecium]|nr:iron-containing alcohol dehydrogenase [Enterococcus faecium]